MTTTTVRTRMTSNSAGRSQILVKWDGKQKTVNSDHTARIGDKHQTAIREVFPGAEVEFVTSNMGLGHTFLTNYWTVTQ